MNPDAAAFIETVLQLYLSLPATPTRCGRSDRDLARHLFQRNIPLPLIEAACCLACARRLGRPPDLPPLAPIRSLHYFLPVIEELLTAEPLPSYLAYCKLKLRALVKSSAK
jgi:hypothetical protein